MTDAPAANAPLDQLVDWRGGRISGHLFVDPDIYGREAERLFLRTWLFLAHESQLRRPGDFVSTFIGTDPLLVVRQAAGGRDATAAGAWDATAAGGDESAGGAIKVMLNACRHRGPGVCRA